MMSFFITLYLFFTTKDNKKKLVLAVIGFVTIVNPVLISLPFFHPLAGTVIGFIGDARGATVSLFMGLMVMIGILGIFSKQGMVRLGSRVGLGILAISTLIGIMMLILPNNKIHEYFVKTSGNARFIYWNMAIEQTKHHWLIGTGPETFRYAHEKYFEPQLTAMGEPWADKPHNQYIETALATGLLGLVAYVVIFLCIGAALRLASKKQENKFFVATASGLLVAYMINNIILFDSMTSMFLFAVIVFWIASEIEWTTMQPVGQVVPKNKLEKIISGILIAIIAVPVVIIIHGEILKLSFAWQELFSQPPKRAMYYRLGQEASGYGEGISFAQRADDYGQRYAQEIAIPRNLVLKDIEVINEVLIDTMMKYPPNTQSYVAMGNLALGYIKQSGSAYPIWVKELRMAGEGIKSLSPKNPKGSYYIQQAEYYEKQQKNPN
jgi:hypothetical protein